MFVEPFNFSFFSITGWGIDLDYVILKSLPWTARILNSSIPRKSVLNIHWKDWHWCWNSNTLATWCEELTHWKRLWCWERLKAGGERDNRGWDGWMASLTQWTWVWASFGSWWWTGKPGMLQSMGSQSWTRLSNWTELKIRLLSSSCLYLLHLAGSCQIHLSPACFSLITPSYFTVCYMISLTEGVCVCVCGFFLLVSCRFISTPPHKFPFPN